MTANLLRFFGGCLFLGLATLSAFPAPGEVAWRATIAATEWGYWLAIAALLPLIPTKNQRRIGKAGAALSLGAIALFLLPVLRAWEMNRALPAAFDATFGPDRRTRAHFAEDPRSEPLVLPELLRPQTLPAVRFEERVFRSLEAEKLTLDIYRPAYEHGRLPGVIVVHGGMWREGNNAEFVALNAYLAGRDFIVAAINYRLAPRWPFPAARDDVLAAIAYMKVYGPEIGLDPTRLAIVGRGAGGQLALLAAYTANDPSIRGVISLYGPTDLQFGYDSAAASHSIDARGTLEAYLGGPPGAAGDAYYAASPINFVTASSPPTLMIHGQRDGIVPAQSSERLEVRLREAGVKHLYVRLPWATHGCDKSFGGPCGQIATYSVERFLDAVMTAPQSPATRTASNLSDRTKFD